jgi:hypothetical protein
MGFSIAILKYWGLYVYIYVCVTDILYVTVCLLYFTHVSICDSF